jgi:hypothetical protein
MKKAITTITLAVVLTLGATFTFANDGIIVAGKPAPTCEPATDGIIVAGKAVINYVFGIIVAGSPGSNGCVEGDGIIVAG